MCKIYCISVIESGRLSNSALFFFFQAEDGIRDIGVTGVQTCALPIYICIVTVIQVSTDLVCKQNLGFVWLQINVNII